MPLPKRLAKGTASHTVRVRVPRYLWHQFLDACATAGASEASEAVRDGMRMFIRKANTRRVKRELLPKGKAT